MYTVVQYNSEAGLPRAFVVIGVLPSRIELVDTEDLEVTEVAVVAKLPATAGTEGFPLLMANAEEIIKSSVEENGLEVDGPCRIRIERWLDRTLPVDHGVEYLDARDSGEVLACLRKRARAKRPDGRSIMRETSGHRHNHWVAIDISRGKINAKRFRRPEQAIEWLITQEPIQRQPPDYYSWGAEDDGVSPEYSVGENDSVDLRAIVSYAAEKYHISLIKYITDSDVYLTVGAAKIRVTSIKRQDEYISNEDGSERDMGNTILEFAITSPKYNDKIRLRHDGVKKSRESLMRFIEAFYW